MGSGKGFVFLGETNTTPHLRLSDQASPRTLGDRKRPREGMQRASANVRERTAPDLKTAPIRAHPGFE